MGILINAGCGQLAPGVSVGICIKNTMANMFACNVAIVIIPIHSSRHRVTKDHSGTCYQFDIEFPYCRV
jgi:hypothetical protein